LVITQIARRGEADLEKLAGTPLTMALARSAEMSTCARSRDLRSPSDSSSGRVPRALGRGAAGPASGIVSWRPPLPRLDAQHCNSLDFAGFLGPPLRSTIRHSGRNASSGVTKPEKKGRRVWGEHLRRRSQARPGTAQPGSILCPCRVNRMSLARACLTAPTSTKVGSLPSGHLALRAGFAGDEKGGLRGTSGAELGENIPTPPWTRGLDR